MGRDALEGKGPQRGSQKRLDRRLEVTAQAVGGGYCRLQMPLRLALGVRETAVGHRLGAPAGGGYLPPFQCIPGSGVVPPPHGHFGTRCSHLAIVEIPETRSPTNPGQRPRTRTTPTATPPMCGNGYIFAQPPK